MSAPYIHHESLGCGTISIIDEVSFRAAKVFWDDIAARFESPTRPVSIKSGVVPEKKQNKKVDAHNIGKKKKRPSSKHGDLQLPVTFSEDKKKYQAAWSLCRKYNFIPYPEAIKRESERKSISEKPETDTPVEDLIKPQLQETAQEKIRALVIAKNGNLAIGDKVKFNGTHASPFSGKSGEIVRLGTKDQILVKFGDSQTWLSKHTVCAITEVTA